MSPSVAVIVFLHWQWCFLFVFCFFKLLIKLGPEPSPKLSTSPPSSFGSPGRRPPKSPSEQKERKPSSSDDKKKVVRDIFFLSLSLSQSAILHSRDVGDFLNNRCCLISIVLCFSTGGVTETPVTTGRSTLEKWPFRRGLVRVHLEQSSRASGTEM